MSFSGCGGDHSSMWGIIVGCFLGHKDGVEVKVQPELRDCGLGKRS